MALGWLSITVGTPPGFSSLGRVSLFSLDTETTGTDIYHGAKPFFVTVCDNDWQQEHWEWEVDPLTREPIIPEGDVKEIMHYLTMAGGWGIGFSEEVRERHKVVGQNIKFDVGALAQIGITYWPWHQTHDTLLAGHILASNKPHNLTEMAIQYLGIDIEPYEKRLEEAVKSARRKVQQARLCCKRALSRNTLVEQGLTWEHEEDVPKKKDLWNWKIAESGGDMTPSAKAKTWKYDTWLPRAVARFLGGEEYGPDHPWLTVLRDYANTDSAITVALWQEQKKELLRRGLWQIYLSRLKVLLPFYRMENRGVTASLQRHEATKAELKSKSESRGNLCVTLARGVGFDNLKLPKNGVSESLRQTLFDGFGLQPYYNAKAKTDKPTLNKATLDTYAVTLDEKSKAGIFIRALMEKRKCDTALAYMESYEKFYIRNGVEGVCLLHPNVNVTGTDTLRTSCQNPNTQQVCVDPETEFLTDRGWVFAGELQLSDKVAQYWKDSGAIDFVVPALRKYWFKGFMKHITTEQHIDMLLTPSHRCLLGNRQTGENLDVPAAEFKPDHYHYQAGNYVGGDVGMSKAEITWLCAVQADGSYTKVGGSEYGIQFTFRKPRKYQRLRESLVSLGAKFSERRAGKLVSFYIGKHEPIVALAKDLMPDKVFGSWLLKLNRDTLDRFCDELFFWDGDFTRNATYGSSVRANADWAQIVFSLSGSRADLVTKTMEKSDKWQPHQSYVMIRRNGKVAITGNSKQGVIRLHSKQGVVSLRSVFGPAPGRVWYALDYENIELRIPAYESGEKEFIALFERPDDPPYFGSYHLLICHVLHPKLFEACKDGNEFKDADHYKSTWYQWTKNGNFAVLYGAVEESGTADRAYHLEGAQGMIKARFRNMTALNDKWVRFAEKYGYYRPCRSITTRRALRVKRR